MSYYSNGGNSGSNPMTLIIGHIKLRKIALRNYTMYLFPVLTRNKYRFTLIWILWIFITRWIYCYMVFVLDDFVIDNTKVFKFLTVDFGIMDYAIIWETVLWSYDCESYDNGESYHEWFMALRPSSGSNIRVSELLGLIYMDICDPKSNSTKTNLLTSF